MEDSRKSPVQAVDTVNSLSLSPLRLILLRSNAQEALLPGSVRSGLSKPALPALPVHPTRWGAAISAQRFSLGAPLPSRRGAGRPFPIQFAL